jgi:hypothetical protein
LTFDPNCWASLSWLRIKDLSREHLLNKRVERSFTDKTAEHERDAGLVADTGDLSHPELGTSGFAFLR